MKKQKNENVSYLSEVLDKLKEHKMAMVGLVVLICGNPDGGFSSHDPEPGILILQITLPFLQLREERTILELMLSGVMFLPV